MGAVQKTAIVIPCYNEAHRLAPQSFLATLRENPDFFFLFVNDGSTDDTCDILASLQEGNPAQVGVLKLEKNSGKAEAVRHGMLKTMEGQFRNIGYWDADLATPLQAIREFCTLLENGAVEAVLGSRVRLLGRRIERNTLRHYLGRTFATCASILLDLSIYDTQCGAKIFRNSPHLKQVLARPFKVNWTFDVELLARFPMVQGIAAKEAMTKWVEYPLREWVDVKGSKIRGRDYLRGAVEFGILFLHLRTPGRTAYHEYLQRGKK